MTIEFDWSEQPGPWNLWHLFDVWRENYDKMTLQDQTEFHREFYKRWTVIHQHGDDRPVDEFFEMLEDKPYYVLEIGGWDGAAANRVLPADGNIREWFNVEFTEEAVLAPVCHDDRYRAEVPEVWPWEAEYLGFNVLFMQHVIEHMKFDQFKRLLGVCPDVEWVFLQSPLDMGPHDWTGYPGCHILEVGWDAIDEFMAESGFEMVRLWWDTVYSTAPENGRTRIYMRSSSGID